MSDGTKVPRKNRARSSATVQDAEHEGHEREAATMRVPISDGERAFLRCVIRELIRTRRESAKEAA